MRFLVNMTKSRINQGVGVCWETYTLELQVVEYAEIAIAVSTLSENILADS